MCIKFIHVVSLHENTICNAIHYEYKFLMCQKHVLGTRDTEHYYYIADKTHLSIIMHILCEHVIVIKKTVSLPISVVTDFVSETAVVVAEGVVMRSLMSADVLEKLDDAAREQSHILTFKHILRIDNNSFTSNGHMIY